MLDVAYHHGPVYVRVYGPAAVLVLRVMMMRPIHSNSNISEPIDLHTLRHNDVSDPMNLKSNSEVNELTRWSASSTST